MLCLSSYFYFLIFIHLKGKVSQREEEMGWGKAERESKRKEINLSPSVSNAHTPTRARMRPGRGQGEARPRPGAISFIRVFPTGVRIPSSQTIHRCISRKPDWRHRIARDSCEMWLSQARVLQTEPQCLLLKVP